MARCALFADTEIRRYVFVPDLTVEGLRSLLARISVDINTKITL
jgi:hypothetical protein